ncbi:LPXTG cell wall anchor domain-containing protein [Christensenellaceae bacterium OttesenSCG-928-M15]|nr:LPXTG cell wall anchor domain-containing protein [Christensenellaceae bacterium OttesenSCG-928-M15]
MHTLGIKNGSTTYDDSLDKLAKGIMVSIIADTAPDGQVFSHWSSSNGGSFADAYSATTAFTMPEADTTVTANYVDEIDPSQDQLFTFAGTITNLNDITLNGVKLAHTANHNGIYWDLSNYRDYTDVLGKMEDGSVKVTLYKEFLQTLPSGVHTLTVEFNDNATGERKFKIPEPSYTFSTGGGISTMTYRATASTSTYTGGDLVITSNGPFPRFTGLKCGNVKLTDGVDYSAASGSTIVTVHESFMKTLPTGKHKFTLLFDHGSANVNVTVNAIAVVVPENVVAYPPKTGDAGFAWTGMLTIVIGAGLLYAIRRRRA